MPQLSAPKHHQEQRQRLQSLQHLHYLYLLRRDPLRANRHEQYTRLGGWLPAAGE